MTVIDQQPARCHLRLASRCWNPPRAGAGRRRGTGAAHPGRERPGAAGDGRRAAGPAGRDPGRERARRGRRGRRRDTRLAGGPVAAQRFPGCRDGGRVAGACRVARPGGHGGARIGVAERPAPDPGAGADGCGGDHLRGAAQRDGRRRRYCCEVRKRRAAAWFGVCVPIEPGAGRHSDRRRCRLPVYRSRRCSWCPGRTGSR